jgi:hypothetical protein
MQIKNIAISALILTTLAFAGCGKKEEAPAVAAPVAAEAAAPAATEAVAPVAAEAAPATEAAK